MTKTALVDCDGVLADFTGAALKGFSLRPEDVHSWEMFEQLRAISKEEYRECIERVNSPHFWANWIKPRPDARGFGDRLQAAGFDRIVIVTSPWSVATMPARLEWLYKTFPGQFDAVVFDKKKAGYPGALFIDDRVENCEGWQTANPQGRALLFDAPYNRKSNLPRLKGWEQLGDVLKKGAA